MNVPDSLPDAILYATPSAPFPVPTSESSRISLSDAPHELNCGVVSPSYWAQIAMIRSFAAGASVVRFGKVWVRLAGDVVAERRVFAPVVGIVGNAIGQHPPILEGVVALPSFEMFSIKRSPAAIVAG